MISKGDNSKQGLPVNFQAHLGGKDFSIAQFLEKSSWLLCTRCVFVSSPPQKIPSVSLFLGRERRAH